MTDASAKTKTLTEIPCRICTKITPTLLEDVGVIEFDLERRKQITSFWDTLTLKKILYIMQINNLQGDITDVSAKTKHWRSRVRVMEFELECLSNRV